MIAGRKSPDAMHVFRQHDSGIDMEGRPSPNVSHRATQCVDTGHEQVAPAVEQIGNEKVGPAWHPVATIVRHRKQLCPMRPRHERA